jgi:hypothetical protein
VPPARAKLEWRALSIAVLGLALSSCEKVGDRAEASATTAPAAQLQQAAGASAVKPEGLGSEANASETNADANGNAGSANGEQASSVSAAPQEPGSADLDASNDDIVAPPEAIADCEARLTALGVSFARAELKVHSAAGVVCGAPQAVLYKGRAGGPRWSPAPLVSCTLALALGRFELLADSEARRSLGAGLRSVEQGGTYNCRKMARFRGIVSEHSYANAIDLKSFRLSDGRTISVLKHFGRPAQEPSSPEGKFLRALARKAFDEGVFSVVLTEFFDTLHRDHFHVDMARYRVDGTR